MWGVRVRAALLGAASTFAAGWAGVLLHAHQDAVRHTLAPGMLCGPDGGCGDVLASPWATLGGTVAVSTPAMPLFAALAVCAALVAAGRLDAGRVAALAATAALGGLAFGAWLLYHMLVSVGHVCPYCLIMDGATAAVLATALALHPGGPFAALREVPLAIRRLATVGPELATVGVVILGTAALTAAFPEPSEGGGAYVAVSDAGVPLVGTAEPSGEVHKVVIPPGQVEVTLTDTTPVLGPADAPVTIVLFEDFQCPFCRKLTGNLDAFRREDPRKVRLAWFHFPMHSACNVREGMTDMHADACGAAVAAECARRQGKFWEYHDLLFRDQRLSSADLLAHAKGAGLDLNAFVACQSDPSARDKVLADTAEGRKFNITGTPTWFINGKRFSGAQPVEALRAIADAVVGDENAAPKPIEVALDGEVTGDVGARPETVTLEGPRGPFTIDTFEATVVDGVARSVSGGEPSRGLSWSEAYGACRAAGKRLCSEDEWLTACTGAVPVDADADGQFSDDPVLRDHPYGSYAQPTWCASARKRDDARPLLAGNHPRCATPEGVFDLEGGVKEWIGLAPHLAALQGGSYFSGDSARCRFHKTNESPETKDRANGFRCCTGPEPQVADAGDVGGRVGDPIRSWSGTTLDGRTFDSESLAGRPYVLVFWASYCAPCRKELPVLAEVYERYRSQGLEIVAVSVDTTAAAASRYLAEQPVPFPVVLDPKSELMAAFDAPSTPTSFLVTRSGRIRQRNIGYDENSGAAAVERDIRALLGAQ